MRREREEAVRLLYVAATRARDLLVVPAVGDEPHPGWLANLNPAIYPEVPMRRGPIERQPPGCPEFGDDSVAQRPADGRAPRKEKSVAPGSHRPRFGNHRVVWWDPSKLELNVQEAMGLRQAKLLEADGDGGVATRGIEHYEHWRTSRGAMLEAASRPALRIATATGLAGAAAGTASPIGIVRLERDPSRPRGKRFGTLVHATLLRAALDAGDDEIARAASMQGRILGASGGEIMAAAAAARAALASDLLERARRARECRRECALLATLDDGTLVEGIADLAFLDSSGGEPCWTIVDFKTDFDVRARLAEYEIQLGLYLRAVSRATASVARGILMLI
jgi:ATP-dependent exoDNAse (exonuclease V) beta subunit